jgi:hypothetical protein
MGDFVPNINARGLPISLDYNIFLVDPGKWSAWYTGNSNTRKDAMASRMYGKRLTEACRKIEKSSASGIRRVCVTCRYCKVDCGYVNRGAI